MGVTHTPTANKISDYSQFFFVHFGQAHVECERVCLFIVRCYTKLLYFIDDRFDKANKHKKYFARYGEWWLR